MSRIWCRSYHTYPLAVFSMLILHKKFSRVLCKFSGHGDSYVHSVMFDKTSVRAAPP